VDRGDLESRHRVRQGEPRVRALLRGADGEAAAGDGAAQVIVGGESGPRARPMERSWVLDIRDRCRSAGVAFFFKQWGGVFKSRTGRELDGRTWDEMPPPADSCSLGTAEQGA